MAKCNCDHRFGTVYRYITGHHKTCPVHLDYMKKLKIKSEKKAGK